MNFVESMSIKPPSPLNQWARKQIDDIHCVARSCANDISLASDRRDAFVRVVFLAKDVSRGILPFSQYRVGDVTAAFCTACGGMFPDCAYRGRLDACLLMKERLAP